MKIFFGVTLSTLGIITLILGLTRIYTFNFGGISSEAAVGGILILGGMIANVIGASTAKGEYLEKFGDVSKLLYIASFITSIAIVIIGLFNVFSPQRTAMSIGLLIIGFVSAISSASNATEEERKKKSKALKKS
jgi:uncharacterized membrane protein